LEEIPAWFFRGRPSVGTGGGGTGRFMGNLMRSADPSLDLPWADLVALIALEGLAETTLASIGALADGSPFKSDFEGRLTTGAGGSATLAGDCLSTGDGGAFCSKGLRAAGGAETVVAFGVALGVGFWLGLAMGRAVLAAGADLVEVAFALVEGLTTGNLEGAKTRNETRRLPPVPTRQSQMVPARHNRCEESDDAASPEKIPN
jgi:hypothetical protein